MKDHINFRIQFRVARGWAGRLDNTSYRLGFLGIMARNEADVGASGVFNRINRFSDFDIIHQGWKFETAFVYRPYAPELSTNIKGGNFSIPFERDVWFAMMWLFAVICLVYWLLHSANIKMRLKNKKQLLEQRFMKRIKTELIQG